MSLFVVEILAIAPWLDGHLLLGMHGVRAIVRDWAAVAVRSAVASLVIFLVITEAQPSAEPDDEPGPVSWRLLLLHALAMCVFLAAAMLAYHGVSPLAGDLGVLAMMTSGLAAVALAAGAFISPAVWRNRIRIMRDLFLFAPVAGLAAYGFGTLSRQLWHPLTSWTFAAVALMLRPFLNPLIADPARASLGSSRFEVVIAPQCSGYEGIGLVFVVTCAWLWFLRRQWRFPNALLLIPFGVAAVWTLNAARIAGLVLIGHAGAEGVALGGFHSEAGWITFSAASLAVCIAARRVHWFAAADPAVSHAEPSGPVPQVAYLAPLFALLSAALVSRAASSSFEWLYGLRVIAAAATIWHFRGWYRKFRWRASPAAGLLGALVFALWIGIDRMLSIPPAGAPEAFLRSSLPARCVWLAFRLAGAILTVPIAEELAFRGFLYRSLVSSTFETVPWSRFAWAPFVLSSLAFGALHGDRWIAGTLAGMVYAFAMVRKGQISDSIAAHAITNALLAMWVFATGNWSFW